MIGVLLALQQHDLKRLLAYHSVENVGIILIGAGMAMLLRHSPGAQPLATLALAAALLHTLNHAAFKGLLFLAAGSVIAAPSATWRSSAGSPGECPGRLGCFCSEPSPFRRCRP